MAGRRPKPGVGKGRKNDSEGGDESAAASERGAFVIVDGVLKVSE